VLRGDDLAGRDLVGGDWCRGQHGDGLRQEGDDVWDGGGGGHVAWGDKLMDKMSMTRWSRPEASSLSQIRAEM
jgi:hypothetical protein